LLRVRAADLALESSAKSLQGHRFLTQAAVCTLDIFCSVLLFPPHVSLAQLCAPRSLLVDLGSLVSSDASLSLGGTFAAVVSLSDELAVIARISTLSIARLVSGVSSSATLFARRASGIWSGLALLRCQRQVSLRCFEVLVW
jgi:hypothetical protein